MRGEEGTANGTRAEKTGAAGARADARGEKFLSRPVSRVLSWAIIHLGCPSPDTSSSLPESSASHTSGFLFGLAPSGVCLAMECCHPCGALLPHHFTLTSFMCRWQHAPQRHIKRRYLSVALSVGSRLPGVTWHSALWSPDFPPWPSQRLDYSDCLADSGHPA